MLKFDETEERRRVRITDRSEKAGDFEFRLRTAMNTPIALDHHGVADDDRGITLLDREPADRQRLR